MAFKMNNKILFFCAIILCIFTIEAKTNNKYSKEANVDKEESDDDHDFRPISLKHLDRPFRMAKLNLLWSKAVHVGCYSYFNTKLIWTKFVMDFGEHFSVVFHYKS